MFRALSRFFLFSCLFLVMLHGRAVFADQETIVIPYDIVQRNFEYLEEPAGDIEVKYTIKGEPDVIKQFKQAHQKEMAAYVEGMLDNARKHIEDRLGKFDAELKKWVSGWRTRIVPKKSREKRKQEIEARINNFYDEIQTQFDEVLAKRVQTKLEELIAKGNWKQTLESKVEDSDEDEEDFGLSRLFAEAEEEEDKEEKQAKKDGGGSVGESAAEAARAYHGEVLKVKKQVYELAGQGKDVLESREELNKAIEEMRSASRDDFEEKVKEVEDPLKKYEDALDKFKKTAEDVEKQAKEAMKVASAADSKKAKTRKKIENARKAIEEVGQALKALEEAIGDGEKLIKTAEDFVKTDKDKQKSAKKEAQGMVKAGRVWRNNVGKSLEAMIKALSDFS